MNWVRNLISDETRATIRLRLFGLASVPMLAYVRPSVVAISANRVVVRIPLRRRTKNHLGSMYFGALSVGADCAAGAITMHLIRQQRTPISLIFKDFDAEFLKRAEGDVDFCCEQGMEIAELVAQAAASEERVERQVEVVAMVPKISDEPVARFKLTISLKKQTS